MSDFFIETLENVLIPMSRVLKIGPPRKGEYEAYERDITTNDNVPQHYTVYADNLSITAGRTAIIKADPGYELLILMDWEAGYEFEFSRIPIIAWRVGDEPEPSPITVNGSEELSNRKAILCPNGNVMFQEGGGEEYDSLAVFEKVMREKHERMKAKRAKEAAE